MTKWKKSLVAVISAVFVFSSMGSAFAAENKTVTKKPAAAVVKSTTAVKTDKTTVKKAPSKAAIKAAKKNSKAKKVKTPINETKKTK